MTYETAEGRHTCMVGFGFAPPSRISVPRPAMFVEMVTAPIRPGARPRSAPPRHRSSRSALRRARPRRASGRRATPTRSRWPCRRAPAGRCACAAVMAATIGTLLRLAMGEDQIVSIEPHHRVVRGNDEPRRGRRMRDNSAAAAWAVPVMPQSRGIAAQEALQGDRAEDASVRPRRSRPSLASSAACSPSGQ